MREFERVLKALANGRRLATVRYLKFHGAAPVGDIAQAIKLSFKATSKHLAILSAAGIVGHEQRSLLHFYSLANDAPAIARRIITLL